MTWFSCNKNVQGLPSSCSFTRSYPSRNKKSGLPGRSRCRSYLPKSHLCWQPSLGGGRHKTLSPAVLRLTAHRRTSYGLASGARQGVNPFYCCTALYETHLYSILQGPCPHNRSGAPKRVSTLFGRGALQRPCVPQKTPTCHPST